MSRMKYLTGQRFGDLTVCSRTYFNTEDNEWYWDCKCDCGNSIEVGETPLRKKSVTSCGKCPPSIELAPRFCAGCGKKLKSTQKQKFCSNRCRQLERLEKEKAAFIPQQLDCINCGATFFTTRAQSQDKYCRGCAYSINAKNSNKKRCAFCGESLDKSSKKKYCNNRCYLNYLNSHGSGRFASCIKCKEKFELSISQSRSQCNSHYCNNCNPSRYKREADSLGKEGSCRRISAAGHIIIYLAERNQFGRKGNVAEHVVVMEDFIQRRLLKEEHVHHKNLDKTDNSINNLIIVNGSEHSRCHTSLNHLIYTPLINQEVIKLDSENFSYILEPSWVDWYTEEGKDMYEKYLKDR